MSEQKPLPDGVRTSIGWPLRLTLAGMVAEQITFAFWPLWTILLLIIAALAFGYLSWAPVELFWATAVALPVALIWMLVRGVRNFRWPRAEDAVARLDGTLPGRPLATLSDSLAVGRQDEGSSAVWQAHLARMLVRVRQARAVPPDLNLARRDPFSMRYAALTAFLMAVLFGSIWKVAELPYPGVAQSQAASVAASWEGWIEPPTYTGRPTLYLNSMAAGSMDVPQGSRVTVRLYGAAEELALSQTVSDKPSAAEQGGNATVPAEQRTYDFTIARSGTIVIDGEGGRAWDIVAMRDAPPTVELTGPMKRMATGAMSQPFRAKDDIAVVKGKAHFELDLASVDRRYGLSAAPDVQPALVFDLPMPVSGSRKDFTEILGEDASKHPWANLPVKMTLTVADATGQTTVSGPHDVILPGRRFFDPLAAAIVETRRDLLWSSGANGKRVVQILKAITYKPEGFFQNQRAYLMLRVALRRLDAAVQSGGLTSGLRDETAEVLWNTALLIEEGGLGDALERMKKAQEKLSEAIRNGASEDEIKKLMDDLRGATDDYLRMLAERGQEDPSDKFAKNQPSQSITQDQIQQMMDEIQKLMEEGKMAEAQALLEQLNQLMQNLKVTEGQGGDKSQQGKGGKSMKDLRQTLRDQQDLSDDAFRQQQGDSRGQSSNPRDHRPGQDRASPGQGEPQDQQGDGEGSGAFPKPGMGLAERQKALRDELRRQQGALPDAQGQDADAARRSLEDAGKAMKEAEDALRDGDMPGAIDRQAEAIEKLRDGMRSLNKALSQDDNRMSGADGQAEGDPKSEMPRDPLGRTEGLSGQSGTEKGMLPGKDVYGRARDLLDEIRRRSSDQTRPIEELDYLRRLLGQY